MDKTITRKDIVFAAVLFVISFAVRFVDIPHIYPSNDSAKYIFEPLRMFNRSFFDLNISNNAIAGLIGFPYGFIIVVEYIFASLLSLVGLSINAYLMSLPIIIFTSLAPVGCYFLISELSNKRAAVFSSIWFSLGFFHVLESKFLGRASITFPLAFLIFGIYFIAKYSRDEEVKTGILGAMMIGFYMVSDVMFLTSVPLIIYTAYISQENESGIKASILKIYQLYVKRPLFIIPVIFLTPYLVAHLYAGLARNDYGQGFIGRMVGKEKIFAFYFKEVLLDYINLLGIPITVLILFSMVYGCYLLLGMDKKSILFVWGFIYCAPFLFFSRDGGIYGYMFSSKLAFIMLISIMIFDGIDYLIKKERHTKIAAVIVGVVFIVPTFYVTSSLAFKGGALLPGANYISGMFIKWIPVFNNLLDYGESYVNRGEKSAGYFVRRYLNSKEYNIFTDIETILSQIYFGRNKVFSLYDAQLSENISYLKEIRDELDAVVIRGEWEDAYLRALKGSRRKFYKVAVIKSNGKDVRYIYSIVNMKCRVLDIKEYDRLFDKEFGKIHILVPYGMKFPANIRPYPTKRS